MKKQKKAHMNHVRGTKEAQTSATEKMNIL